MPFVNSSVFVGDDFIGDIFKHRIDIYFYTVSLKGHCRSTKYHWYVIIFWMILIYRIDISLLLNGCFIRFILEEEVDS